MRKILYIITKSDIGGAQKYVADLAANLNPSKFEGKIIYGGKDIKWLSNDIRPWSLFLNDWLAVFEIVRILKNEKPDVIHLNSSKAGVIGSIAAAITNLKLSTINEQQIKVVFTAHGWVFNPTNALKPAKRRLYILLHKITALFQDKIICVSEYDYKLATEYNIAPKWKLAAIHNGINAEELVFLNKAEAQRKLIMKINENLKLKNQKLKTEGKNIKIVGSIGRLVKEKNFKTLIRAAEIVKNAIFIIIGEGPKEERLKQIISESKLEDKAFLLPPEGNDAKYLKGFDVFAISSIKEGLPYILLEAMAAQLPIVITETGGMPEVIKNHENGLMVSRENPEQLAKAIGGLLENPSIAKDLGEAAKEAVTEKFSLKQMADLTEKIYDSLFTSR